MEAMTLRSTDTGKATPGRNDMMIPKILARRQRIYGFVSSAKIDFKKMPSKALEGLALALSTQGLFLILMAVKKLAAVTLRGPSQSSKIE